MVNHLHTLLLNMTAAEAAPLTTTYVPWSYTPVPVPAAVARPLALLLPPTTAAGRVAAVHDLTTLCHAGELDAYAHRFDPRLTYSVDTSITLTAMCGRAQLSPALAGIMARLANATDIGAAHAALFNWPEYEADMKALLTLWSNPSEGVLRVGALTLAVAYQLERARRQGQ